MNLLTFFLSWLVQTLASMRLVIVTAIFAAIGMIMFLLPPVPGTPVYLGAGLLLTSTAEREWAPQEYLDSKEVGLYFWMAAAYAMVVALAIKLVACASWYKMPCLRTPPRLPPWWLQGPRPLLPAPERALSSLEARGCLSSPAQTRPQAEAVAPLQAARNAAFDMCGMACGWLEMPFWTFLGATVLGKGFTKVTIQCMVCITVTLSLLLTLTLTLTLTLKPSPSP